VIWEQIRQALPIPNAVALLAVQSFQKVPALKALAPTQSEPPFLVAQLLALIIFVVLGILAAIKFHPARESQQ